jgi:hypothetical protein
MYSGEKVLFGLERGKAADYAMRLNLAADKFAAKMIRFHKSAQDGCYKNNCSSNARSRQPPSPLAFQDGTPIYIPVAKTRIPAAPVTCERICGST